MVDGHWNLSNLSYELPESIKNTILATPLRRFSNSEDQRSWVSILNGNFDPRNAYLLAVGEKGTPDEVDMEVKNPPKNSNVTMEVSTPKPPCEKCP